MPGFSEFIAAVDRDDAWLAFLCARSPYRLVVPMSHHPDGIDLGEVLGHVIAETPETEIPRRRRAITDAAVLATSDPDGVLGVAEFLVELTLRAATGRSTMGFDLDLLTREMRKASQHWRRTAIESPDEIKRRRLDAMIEEVNRMSNLVVKHGGHPFAA